ncbi:endonuclease NucS [Natronococcus occultus]|uniref:Endonuclease NucS n=1 Tax=Natronococcus occultus SP4 TaxID=694430 RepID=L0K0P4_9EURY|nr:endonuclease NucS [Natronococcus occultus]AGB38576.1 putative nuclease of the RecB family [Natronococcus occultus SP4]
MTSGTRSPQATTLERPALEDARDAIVDGIEREAMMTVFGRCTVDYDGRASSQLEAGDRHLMLKPDGAALVHTDEGQQPVNWQPPGCEHSVRCEDGALVIESVRSSPEERLAVSFELVLQVSTFAGSDPTELAVVGTEEDLRQRILEEPRLLEEGFTPLATERDTPAGAVDIYGEDATGRSVVVELKRRRVGPDAVSQLRRYVDALERDLHADASVRGVLVAPSVTDRADRLLARHGLEFVALEPTE